MSNYIIEGYFCDSRNPHTSGLIKGELLDDFVTTVLGILSESHEEVDSCVTLATGGVAFSFFAHPARTLDLLGILSHLDDAVWNASDEHGLSVEHVITSVHLDEQDGLIDSRDAQTT